MSVNRVRKRGSYAPLSVHYYKDEAIMRAGPAAELLYVRGLAFCAETLSDGFIAHRQLSHLTIGLSNVRRKVVSLVSAGLWTESEGGWYVTSWLSWNRSREEIIGAEEKDRDRKKPQVTPPQPPPKGGSRPPDSVRNPDGIQTESERLARRPARGVSSSSSSSTPEENPAGSPSVAELPRSNPPGRRGDDRSATLEPGNGEIVAAWIDSYKANGTNPTRNTIAQVGKEIKTLVEAGNNPILVLEAAKQAGAKGFRTIERELGSMNGKLIDTRRFRKPTPTENRDRIAAELDAEMGWPPVMRVVNGDG